MQSSKVHTSRLAARGSLSQRGETAVSRLTGVGFADHLRNAVVPPAPYALLYESCIKK